MEKKEKEVGRLEEFARFLTSSNLGPPPHICRVPVPRYCTVLVQYSVTVHCNSTLLVLYEYSTYL